MSQFCIRILYITIILATFGLSSPVPTNDAPKETKDHWHSLTEHQQFIILNAYYAGAIPSNIQACERVEECPVWARCDETWKLCVPKESPHFPKTDGSCQKHADCKPMYRCAAQRCLLTGPIACKGQEDCLDVPGLEFVCLERPNQVPGKKCWRKCSVTRDCLECDTSTPEDDLSSCRIPKNFLQSTLCEEGFCSKNLTSLQ